MRGIPTKCYICGCEDEVFGCPSFQDACVDKQACRARVVLQLRAKEEENKRLREKISRAEQTRTTYYRKPL